VRFWLNFCHFYEPTTAGFASTSSKTLSQFCGRWFSTRRPSVSFFAPTTVARSYFSTRSVPTVPSSAPNVFVVPHLFLVLFPFFVGPFDQQSLRSVQIRSIPGTTGSQRSGLRTSTVGIVRVCGILFLNRPNPSRWGPSSWAVFLRRRNPSVL
jgi:hypothetical protein